MTRSARELYVASGDDLSPEEFPSLGTISAAHFYTFIPVLSEPVSPELVYLPKPGNQDGIAYFGAVASWNSLWESGP